MTESSKSLHAPEGEGIRPANGQRNRRAPTPGDSESVDQGTVGMEDLLAGAEQEMPTLRRGEVVAGVIAAVDRDGILVDIGLKSEGIIPGFEAQRLIEADQVHVDDEVLVLVIQLEDEEGRAILSLSRARAEKSWRTVQRQFEEGEMLEAEVVDHNRGGLIVDADGVRGFVPMSQVAGLHVTGVGEDEIRQQLAEMLHHRISVKVLEVNRRRSRLILSERAVVQERRSQRKEELLAELREGEIRHGRVTSLTEFGAFIDLGGADGLVHLSELSWKPVSHPREVLKVGEEVDVRVLMIDREKKKIALSLRRTQPEPWTTAAERYKPGDLVTGTITKLAAFGAFARLEEGIEGLIHVSELAEGRVTHPRNVVNEGDVLTLRVLRVDPSRRRLGLSLRQVTNPEFVVDESRSEDAGHAEHGVHHKDTKG